MAIKRVGPDLYYLIDPNYGIYSRNEAGVKAMMTYLFATVYNQAVDGWHMTNKGNYAVLRRAQA